MAAEVVPWPPQGPRIPSHKHKVAAVQVAWSDALDQDRAGAVQRDQRATTGRGAMRLKIRIVGEVGFAELNYILARIKPADGVSSGSVGREDKVIFSSGGVQCDAGRRATDELHTVATVGNLTHR
jgi:hypothetical protein